MIHRVLCCLLLLSASLAWGAGNEPVNTLPTAGSNFTVMQNYLKNEFPATAIRWWPHGKVYTGGSHGTKTGRTSDAFATEAVTSSGNRVTADGSGGAAAINYTSAGCDTTDTAWVIISAAAGAALDNFVRLTGTNYFVD